MFCESEPAPEKSNEESIQANGSRLIRKCSGTGVSDIISVSPAGTCMWISLPLFFFFCGISALYMYPSRIGRK